MRPLNKLESFPGGTVVKNPSANAGDPRDVGSIPGSGRFTGGGNGNPLQYSCLGNPMDRGVWWARVHGVQKNRTQLSTHTHTKLELVILKLLPLSAALILWHTCRTWALGDGPSHLMGPWEHWIQPRNSTCAPGLELPQARTTSLPSWWIRVRFNFVEPNSKLVLYWPGSVLWGLGKWRGKQIVILAVGMEEVWTTGLALEPERS